MGSIGDALLGALFGAAAFATVFDRIRESLELTKNGITELYEETRLLTHKGIGHHHGAHLRQLGYRRVEDIRGADVNALYAKLEAARAGARFPGLRPSMVRVWVLAAEAEPEH